jgi:hypothetical protein
MSFIPMHLERLRNILVTLSAASIAVLIATLAWAATQGTLGATSTGTTVITVTIPTLFKISRATDFVLGIWPKVGNLTANQDLCVYSNGTGSYGVTATDNSTMSAAGFSVQNAAATAQIVYTVRWNQTTGTTGNVNLVYNTRRGRSGANVTSTDCSVGGLTANVQVTLTAAALGAAPPGNYSATLILLIQP